RDAGEMKVEWYVQGRFIEFGTRQMSEGGPRRESAGCRFKVELAPRRFPVGERLSVIGARDLDRACNCRSVGCNQGRQKNLSQHSKQSKTPHANVQYAHVSGGRRPFPRMDCKPTTRNTR